MSHEPADVVEALAELRIAQRLLVAVDGVKASGKTTFATWLAEALRSFGRHVQVIHVDDFLHVPRCVITEAATHQRATSTTGFRLGECVSWAYRCASMWRSPRPGTCSSRGQFRRRPTMRTRLMACRPWSVGHVLPRPPDISRRCRV